MKIEVEEVPAEQRGECPSELGFGGVFADHMFTQHYDEDRGWHDARVAGFANLTLHPAASVLHYVACTFDSWMRKYVRLRFIPTTNTGSMDFHHTSRQLVNECLGDTPEDQWRDLACYGQLRHYYSTKHGEHSTIARKCAQIKLVSRIIDAIA